MVGCLGQNVLTTSSNPKFGYTPFLCWGEGGGSDLLCLKLSWNQTHQSSYGALGGILMLRYQYFTERETEVQCNGAACDEA